MHFALVVRNALIQLSHIEDIKNRRIGFSLFSTIDIVDVTIIYGIPLLSLEDSSSSLFLSKRYTRRGDWYWVHTFSQILGEAHNNIDS